MAESQVARRMQGFALNSHPKEQECHIFCANGRSGVQSTEYFQFASLQNYSDSNSHFKIKSKVKEMFMDSCSSYSSRHSYFIKTKIRRIFKKDFHRPYKLCCFFDNFFQLIAFRENITKLSTSGFHVLDLGLLCAFYYSKQKLPLNKVY